MITVTTNGLTNLVFEQGPPTIVINLTGNEEVPPIQTEATGVAEITPGVDSIAYSMNAMTQLRPINSKDQWLGSKYLI